MGMGKVGKIIVVLALVGAVAVVFALKGEKAARDKAAVTATPDDSLGGRIDSTAAGIESTSTTVDSTSANATAPLPRLVDFGSTTCIPCKMMAPILDELKEGYKGRIDVAFVDVGKDSSAWQPFNISTIPTQIFFDAGGKELYRHEGFISKEDILAKWQELGFDLEKGASGAKAQ